MNTSNRILVVDDEAQNRRLLEQILATLAYTVESASDGFVALEKLKTGFDLVLLDVMMPGMDGFEVVRRIRDDPEFGDIPIIMVTVLDDRDTRLRAVQAGVNDFIAKPVDRIEVTVRVASLLRMKKAQDTIKRHQAELEETIDKRTAALLESERRFRTVADFAYDWEYWISPDRRFLYVSPSCERITGYSRDDFAKDPALLERIIYPDDLATYAQHVYKTLLFPDAGEDSFDFRIVSKDGRIRWINHVCRAVHGESGEGLGRRVCHRDITDRKRAEQALQQSEKQLRLLFAESPIGIGIVQDGKYVYVNPALIKAMGCNEANEIVGRSPLDFIAPEDRDLVRQRGRMRLEGRETAANYQVRGIRNNSERFDVSIWPKRIDYSDRFALLCFVLDVSEENKLRSQLIQAQKMEAIGTLAGGVAHDFNNILQVVLGYSDLLLTDKTLDKTRQENLRKVYTSAQRGAELVKRLLTFSRKSDAHPRILNLNDEVTQVKKLLERTIPKMISIELRLEDDLPVIKADSGQVEQILLNLAVNAKDAIPEEGGRITIETKTVVLDDQHCEVHVVTKPGPHVILSVSDTGHGMTQETLEHIFEPFFTTKEVGKGTGLGLAMVYGIVQQQGGYISCESKPDYGTTFRMYFPVVSTELEENVEESSSVVVGGSETVLWVDDEEFVCDMGKQFLTPAGYTLLTATRGKEAIEIYSKQPSEISLVILDLIMPEMGGVRCLEELVRINPQVKVIVSSGFVSDETEKNVKTLGAKGFITKPYNIKQLLKTVREILDEN